MEPHNRGYRREIFIDQVDDKFLCAECELVLRQPRQNPCGHRFCFNCAEDVSRRGHRSATCKLCQVEGSVGDYSVIKPDQMFPDRAVEREIKDKRVRCPNPGCNFEDFCKNYDAHESGCRFKLTKCPRCGHGIPEPSLEEHVNKNCPERMIDCRFCNKRFRNADKELHNFSCPKFPLRCGGCGKNKIPRDQMLEHVLSCPSACPYQTLGCPPAEHKDIQAHLRDSSQQHMLLLIRRVAGKASQEDTVNYIQSLIGGLENRIQALESGRPTAEESAKLEECCQQVVVNIEVIKVLKNEISALHQVFNTFAATSREEQGRILELENKVRQLERTLSLKDVALAEQELRLRTLELTSYDGTMLWKITDFKKKHAEAVAGRTISLYSPAFYTSRTGYKMCGRVYLNGDGMGKGSHVSLFFVIMRGHYDNLLKWPFRQKVTFMLLDQDNHEHIIDAFRPDPNSSSFKLPTSEMNIASGCPLFAPFAHLRLEDPNSPYVKNDTIFVKIIVDCSDLA